MLLMLWESILLHQFQVVTLQRSRTYEQDLLLFLLRQIQHLIPIPLHHSHLHRFHPHCPLPSLQFPPVLLQIFLLGLRIFLFFCYYHYVQQFYP